ncbi:MAG TPA: hypothetical protein VGM13_08445 [Thermoanaerobaculia bacterium]|jgi:hypothetical protein
MFASAVRRTRLSAAFVAVLAAAPAALAQKPARTPAPPPRVRVEIGACEEALWANMPGGMSSSVELANAGTTPECAALALGTTKQALTSSAIVRAAAKSASLTVELLSKLNPWGLTGDAAMKVLQAALESGGTADGFKSQLGEKAMEQGSGLLGEIAGGAGKGSREVEERLLQEFGEAAFNALRGTETVETHSDRFRMSVCDGEFTVTVTASFLEARGEVRIVSNGDCKCSPFAGGVRIGAFAVVGVAPLTFGNLRKQGDDWVLTCTLGGPHYDVWAPCCQVRDDHWVSPRETPVPAAVPVPEPTPTAAERKRAADRANVSRRCDPDGRLASEIFRLGIRFDWKRADGAPENVQRAAREELTRAQKPLCDCLNAMRADPSLRGDRGLMDVIDEMLRDVCSPPAEVTPKPTPAPQIAPPPCSAERDAYEGARTRWSNNPDNAEATLSMVRMREGFCACLKRQHGGKLPPDLEAFCNPKVTRNGASAPVLAAVPPATPASPQTAAGPPRFTAPPTCGAGETLKIAGTFDGDAGNTRVSVGGQPARVVTESPRDCVTQAPAGLSTGPVEILVTEGGRTTRLRSAAIRLRMSADQRDLLRGQSTKFHVVVEGLNGIPDSAWNGGPDPQFLDLAALERAAPGTRIPGRNEPGHVLLTIENASRDTVTFAKGAGDVIRLVIRRSDVSAQGTYAYHGVIQSLQDGRFNIKGAVFALVAPAAGEPSP